MQEEEGGGGDLGSTGAPPHGLGTVGPDGRDRIVFRFQYIKALMPETLI